MKKARNLWRDLPQGGSRYGSVLTRLFLLLCLLATTQAGWADSATFNFNDGTSTGLTIEKSESYASYSIVSSKTNNIPVWDSYFLSTSFENGSSGTITITTDVSYSNITSISFNSASTDNGNPKIAVFVVDNDNKETSVQSAMNMSSGTTKTWRNSPYAIDLSSSPKTGKVRFKLTVTSSGKYAGLDDIVITYGSAKAAAGLAYSTATVNKNVGDAKFTNPLTNPNGLSDITYSITNNGTGSSIIESTGEVTVGSNAGSETVTASFAGDSDYNAQDVTYTLNVTAPQITFVLDVTNGGSTLRTITGTGSTIAHTSATTSTDLLAGGLGTGGSNNNDKNKHNGTRTLGINTLSAETADKYFHVDFTVDNGYKFTPSAITLKALTIGGNPTSYKAVLTDGTNQIVGTVNATDDKEVTLGNWSGLGSTDLTGNVTLKLYAWYTTSGTYNAYRLSTPITITGTVAEAEGPVTPTAVAPTFSPASGEVTVGDNITLATTTDGATIHWKWDIDTDVASSSNTGTSASTEGLSAGSHTLYAVAVKSGYNNSTVSSATYTVNEAASTSGTATFDYSASGATASSWTQAPITVETNATGIDGDHFLKGFTAPLTITLSGANITKVVVHYQNANRKATAITANDGTALSNESTTDTWDNAAGSTNLTLTLTGSPRVTGIDVTYGESVATYDIHYNTVDHGELSGAAKAAAGARVTVTAEPATNYGLSSLTIYKTDDSDVTSECNVSGNQFTMPAYAVKVGGTFALLPTITKNFESTQGNVSTSPETYAAPGAMVTIDADAASGYSVGTITVTDADNNNITVTDNQFTMPNSNVTVTVTFNAAAVSEGDKWNFTTMTEADDAKYKADNTKWNTTDNSSYYYSKFSTSAKNEQTDVISTTIQQIKDLKFVRTDGGALSAGKVRIYLPTSTDAGYLNFNTSNGGIVLPNMAAGTLITVDFNGGGSSYGILPTNATTVDGAEITSVIKSATRTTTTFKVKTAGEVIITGNNSKVKFYKITVGEAVNVAEPTFDKADGSGYDGTGNLSVTVTTKETGEGTKTTYWAFATTALDRDAIVAANNGFTTNTATAEITAANVNQQAIVLSAVTKYVTGTNTYYSDVVTATYPYTGKYTPSMTGSTIQIQQGDRHTIEPEITLPDGSKFNPEEDTQNEGKSSIHDYFDFTYQMTEKTGTATQYITLDGVSATGQTPTTGGVVNTKDDNDNRAEVGDRATIHIVATKKSGFPEGTWPFASDQCETNVTIEVIKKVKGAMMKFYWDPEFKKQVSTTEGVEWDMDGTLTVFRGEFSNGRMFYVKPEPGYKVYVAAGVSDSQLTASKVDGISKSGTVYKYPYRKNDPTDEYPDAPIEYNGIPLLVDDFGGASTKTYYLALVTYNSEGKPEGSAVNAKFTIKNDESKRPGDVTFNPSENNAKRNTAQTVLTQGVNEAYVYGKFSGTKTSYNTHTLIQEPGINGGQTNVGVFSTEVDKRKISALQIAQNADGFYYMGTQKTNTYEYLFASEISLKSNTYTTNVWDGKGSAETVDVKTLIDKITYYNKDSKKDINIADSIQAHSGETAPVTTKEIDRVTYSIQYFNGAGGTGVTDGTTLDGSVVTIGKHSGYVVVTATYPGGYKKKVNSRTNVTDESKATYTIYLVNPDEEIPTITPGSRNFIDEQSFIIQAPKTWYTLYMVQKETDSDYNVDPAEYKSDDSRVKMLKAGEYVRLSVSETSKVRAFAFDYDKYKSGNPETTGHDTSHEVTATYTYLEPLKAPTLSPYGTSEEPHIRTAKSLTVIATTNDPYSGLEVYYTLDGSDPTPTTGEKYNGSEKINISGASTTIKAITYRPETGQISPVTTGVYMYTGSIKQPKFQVNNAGNYTSGTIKVSPSDIITITSEDGGDIYYTLDGATPTTADAVPYTTTGFTIVKNTTGKAIAVKDDASSPITTVEFELATEKNDLWEAVEETTPGGKLDANDRYVAVGNTGHSSTKAVKYLTATFGGMDKAGWNKTSIGEKTQGTPLDGVGEYSITTTRDVWDETDAEVKNTASTVHGKTFALPAKGNFVRFEPQRDGDLTIWLLQQGGLHYTDDGDLCNQFIRLRPVYMFDEKGTSIPATAIKSSARLSDNWNDLDVSDTPVAEGRYGNWVAKDKSQNGVVNKYYTEGESEAIYNMYKSYLTTGGNDISSGDPIAPFEIPNGSSIKNYMETKAGITDGHGYVMPSGGNVKYTFRVKGGKSYYFFGYRTKLAIRGFQFTPLSETVAKSVTVADNTANIVTTIKAGETGGEIETDEICNVTYNRKFTAGKWAAVTFPFSVSVAQMKEVFGNQVDLIHFDNVSGSKINFKRHWYPMIVAGTPVFIKPSKEDMGESVEFKGVRIEAETVNAVSGVGGYKMTGSFTPATINEGDYYISGGKLAVRKGNSINTNACRSWLTADSNNGARFDLTTGTADAFAEEAWSVIGNPQPFVASDETVVTYINGVQEDGIINNIFEGPTGIYTINGQLIRKDATSLEGLSKGIYIVNGKKIAVK